MAAIDVRDARSNEETAVWLSYDLGIGGDYENLYAWLDENGAEECGDNVALLRVRGVEDVAEHLRSSIERRVGADKRLRVYVVFRDPASGRNKGVFLFGRRRQPPWTGFARAEPVPADEG
jgi:hypothetical protein